MTPPSRRDGNPWWGWCKTDGCLPTANVVVPLSVNAADAVLAVAAASAGE